MSSDALATARRIAGAVGVPYEDLTDELPHRQAAAIRDRVARHVLALREEALGKHGQHDKRVIRSSTRAAGSRRSAG